MRTISLVGSLACVVGLIASGCGGSPSAEDVSTSSSALTRCPAGEQPSCSGDGPKGQEICTCVPIPPPPPPKPVAIATTSAADPPTDVAVDATSFYFTTLSGKVMTCPLGGCVGAPTELAAVPVMASDIEVDSQNVYWLQSSASGVTSILSCSKAGCGGQPTTLASSTLPINYAIDAENVYWDDWETEYLNGNVAGSIKSCPKTGCTGAPTVLASNRLNPGAVATDGTRVYWLEDWTEGTPYVGAQIATVPTTGGATTVITTFAYQVPAQFIALDSTNVYVVGEGNLESCFKTGCPAPTTLALGQDWSPDAEVKAIASDGTNVYWTTERAPYADSYDGSMLRCGVGGCGGTPTKLDYVAGLQFWGMTLDANNVYWVEGQYGVSESAPGMVMKLAKTP